MILSSVIVKFMNMSLWLSGVLMKKLEQLSEDRLTLAMKEDK